MDVDGIELPGDCLLERRTRTPGGWGTRLKRHVPGYEYAGYDAFGNQWLEDVEITHDDSAEGKAASYIVTVQGVDPADRVDC
ncbi:MAG: hypothetical protein R6V85_02070 [Polyangia bacterium]